MKNLKKKLISLFLAAVMTFTVNPNISIISGDESPATYSVVIDFANDNPGSAYGDITVTTKEAGTYMLYWDDSEGNKLKYNGVEYSELATCETTSDNLTATYHVPSEYTASPEGATELAVYNEDDLKVASCEIPETKQFDEGELSYKFGLMSDVHYNRYSDYSDDDAVEAFDNALKFMDSQGIDFVGMTGDLSTSAELSAYKKYNAAINKYPNMTVYTCMGNHDASFSYYEGNSRVYNFSTNVNLKLKTDKNIKTVDDLGVDFVYEKNGDIFIFFSQVQWKYSKSSFIVTDSQLNWLEKNLNTYAGKNVFLFFHTYFASENGDVTTAVGNLINPGGYTYDLTYVYGSKDEKRFRSLLNKYPNVTMFNGHSHWAYDQQKYNSKLNIGNIKDDNTGATLVHISSVSAPRTIETDSAQRDENNGQKSEGTVAFKYKNSTVYTGVDFKNGRYLAYATYLNTDGQKGTPIPAVKVGKTKITSVGKIKKVSKKSKKYKVKIRYRKVTDAYKYQIQYSTSKKFKTGKTKSKISAKTSYTITKLKNNTTYYVRVRAYRYQFGYRVYGKWSKEKKVKLKKRK
jgi:hypothetical protein